MTSLTFACHVNFSEVFHLYLQLAVLNLIDTFGFSDHIIIEDKILLRLRESHLAKLATAGQASHTNVRFNQVQNEEPEEEMECIQSEVGSIVLPIVRIGVDCTIKSILFVSEVNKCLPSRIEVYGVRQGVGWNNS